MPWYTLQQSPPQLVLRLTNRMRRPLPRRRHQHGWRQSRPLTSRRLQLAVAMTQATCMHCADSGSYSSGRHAEYDARASTSNACLDDRRSASVTVTQHHISKPRLKAGSSFTV